MLSSLSDIAVAAAILEMMWNLDVQRNWFNRIHDHGFWSPSDSTANFCEEDYHYSHYVAEFINTITNFAYIYYALYPPATINGYLLAKSTPLQSRARWLDFQAVALLLVGISSAAFHMTLHQTYQYCDESSMYVLAASWIYSLLTTYYVKKTIHPLDHSLTTSSLQRISVVRRHRKLVASLLISILAVATICTAYTGHLTIHSTMFLVLLIVSGIKLIYLIIAATSTNNLDAVADSIKIESSIHKLVLQNSATRRLRKVLFISLFKAIFFLCLAFMLWVVDSNPAWCPWLRHFRNEVLGQVWYFKPLGVLTELHGWWHILTAMAAGEYLALVRVLTVQH